MRGLWSQAAVSAICVADPSPEPQTILTDLRNGQERQTFRCFEVDDRVVLGIGHADSTPPQYGYQGPSRQREVLSSDAGVSNTALEFCEMFCRGIGRTLILVTPFSVIRIQCIRLRLMAHMCIASGLPPPARSSSSTAKVTMPRIAGKRFTSSGARFGRAWKVNTPSVKASVPRRWSVDAGHVLLPASGLAGKDRSFVEPWKQDDSVGSFLVAGDKDLIDQFKRRCLSVLGMSAFSRASRRGEHRSACGPVETNRSRTSSEGDRSASLDLRLAAAPSRRR